MRNQQRTRKAKTTQSAKQALFAKNVRWVCECMGHRNYKEAADAFKISHDWLRRAATQGIGWTRGEKPDLEKLADYFGVPKAVFWDDSSEQLRMAVLAKGKPDHVAHCVTLEAVLRHYGNHRPDLLKRCLDVITHYTEKIADPSIESPEDRYCFVGAFQEQLTRLRLLPKREVLEEVVEARINRERRQDRLRSFQYEESWNVVKIEIVNMLVHMLSEFIQQERVVDDQAREALVALAERYAQRLWEGEFAPEEKTAGSSQPKAKSGEQVATPESLAVPVVRRLVVPGDQGSQHVLSKWTGSNRRQPRQIVAQFPRRIDTYYEPFLGGGSVLYELLGSDIEVGRYEVSDFCKPLVDLWQIVRCDPAGLVDEYTQHWLKLQSGGASYYNAVRREFNQRNDPHLFFFLLRTCSNGIVQFNADGKFISAYHRYRPGMNPNMVAPIVQEWGRRLASKDVRISVRNYREITAQEGDFLYLDPPCYPGRFDFKQFTGWLRNQPCAYLLSLNGRLGDQFGTVAVPTDLYDEHLPPIPDSLYIRRRGAHGSGASG